VTVYDLDAQRLAYAFRRATAIASELRAVPSWRRRKRERLRTRLRVACMVADDLREAMGAKPGAAGLLATLEAQDPALVGRR
jgi:hypothetical protein